MRDTHLPLLLRRQTALSLSAVLAVLLLVAQLPFAVGSELRRTAIVRAVEKAGPSVVSIHGEKTVTASYDQLGNSELPRRVNGVGTGVIIDHRGYIVTNHHVVQGVRRIQVTLAEGNTHIARLISFDPDTDLAVIKINAPDELPVIATGTSSDLMPGETVAAVGNAYGYKHTVTCGIISALHRTVQVSDNQQYEDLIQTDASINPGNSGGPLLNVDGEMIGLNVAVRAGAQGIGFAIPVDKVLNAVTKLLSVQKLDNHWHGIVATENPAGRSGLVVARVEDDSPGGKGGLRPGDVITEVGEYKVTRALDIERALLGRNEGDKVPVVVRRNDQPLTLSVVLATPDSRIRSTTEQRSWDVLGMELRRIPDKQFRQYNSRYRGGLTVTDVRPGSPADSQGIRSGDVLVGMHIWETISLENVSYVLNRPDLKDIEPIKFYILRGQETLYGHLPVVNAAQTR